MKVVSRVLAALVAAALTVPLLASPILAAVLITSVSIYPSNGPVGTKVYLAGSANDDSSGYVYFAIDTDYDDSDYQRVLQTSGWDWDEYESGTPPQTYFEYETPEFDIPECIGGDHRIYIVKSNLGTTASYDDVYDARSTSSSYRDFTVTPKLQILSSNKGSAGSQVEVKGTGFGYRENISIFIDGDAVDLVATIKSNDNGTWSGTFIVPMTSQGSHDITAGGSYTDEDDVPVVRFTVEPGITISAKKGIVGSEFVVNGSGFRSSEQNIEIMFDARSVKSGIRADSDGVFQTTVIVPAAEMGEHEVGAKGQSTSLSSVEKQKFEIEPSLVAEPLSGAAGTEIEVSATGLPGSTAVTVSYDGATKGTGTTAADGTLAAITFAATHTQSTHTVDHLITAVFNNTTLTATFEMESTPPAKPTPRSPLSGTRIGLLGKQMPTLTWSVVDDPSGVSYGLQISTTPDFSQILISKSALVAQGSAIIVSSYGPEMTYTLSDAEALPFGTYYWRVKAVDGAMNDSGWSSSSTFKAGLLPTWALIVIIALAAILVGALIYVLIIRDRVGLYD